jgi:hypothetical protein
MEDGSCVVVLQPAKRGLPKPPKKRSKIAGGGRAPKEAGRRKEREFANQYDFTRVVGSGAFGVADPTLGGDIRGEVGTKKFLLEVKSWEKVNARGEKTINLPISILDKIRQEAEVLTRYGGVIFHPKGTSRYIAIFDWNDFYQLLKSQEEEIERLSNELSLTYGDYK